MNKSILGIGTVTGGSFGLVEIKAIGNRAYKWFFEDNFVQDDSVPKDIIEIEQQTLMNNTKPPSMDIIIHTRGYNFAYLRRVRDWQGCELQFFYTLFRKSVFAFFAVLHRG